MSDRGRVFSSLLMDPGPSGQGASQAIFGNQRLEPIDHVSFQTNLALYLLRWPGLDRVGNTKQHSQGSSYLRKWDNHENLKRKSLLEEQRKEVLEKKMYAGNGNSFLPGQTQLVLLHMTPRIRGE